MRSQRHVKRGIEFGESGYVTIEYLGVLFMVGIFVLFTFLALLPDLYAAQQFNQSFLLSIEP